MGREEAPALERVSGGDRQKLKILIADRDIEVFQQVFRYHEFARPLLDRNLPGTDSAHKNCIVFAGYNFQRPF